MTQDIIANFFTFSDAHGTHQINYYPHARLEYQGPEGHFVYPGSSPGVRRKKEPSFRPTFLRVEMP